MLGINLRCEKIKRSDLDEDMVALLNRYHITSLPTLKTNDGSLFIGVREIVAMFEKNAKTTTYENKLTANPNLIGDATSDFWNQELFGNDGRPREDQEEDENADMNKKISSAQRNTKNNQISPSNRRFQDFNDKVLGSSNPNNPNNRHDNIDEPQMQGFQSSKGDADDDMLQAWKDRTEGLSSY
jgi:hypothetical protein